MISAFFLKRPIFATVVAILLVLIGAAAYFALPIEQFPNITPPQIMVSVNYPGASASTIADTVGAPLENQINGVEDMIYMYSESSASGFYNLSVFFDIGADVNQALNNVQDRVNLAMSQLPEEVQREGVSVKKQTPTILLLVALQSPSGRYDDVFVSNYANIQIAEALQRLNGVSNAEVVNARNYSMRIWLRPDEMAQLGISTSDVVESIQNQNADYPIGQLGAAPTLTPVTLTVPVTALGRLKEPEEFEEIILRAKSNGATALIRDIGHVELGAQDYSVNGAIDGKFASLIAVYQDYGSNALDIASEVKATLKRMSKRFPPGLSYFIPYDTTTYIKISIEEVEKTLVEAALIVALVVFIFLQSLRATIIPVIAMVISIIGTFAGMHLLGFSLNSLTLFGLVLAVGIVVDDAIVVTENVERNMREKNLPPYEAAFLAMKEVSAPIIAIVFVLCAVFIPVAFIGGIAGGLYKQFALTISVSVIFSGIVALTFSPVLAVFLFKKNQKPSRAAKIFNKYFDKFTDGYLKAAGWLIDRTLLGTLIFLAILGGIFFLFKTLPSSLVPEEDQGYIFTFAMAPDNTSLDRLEEVTNNVAPMALENPAVSNFISITGFSLLENVNRTNIASYFIMLKNWKDRKTKAMQAQGVLKSFGKEFSKIPEARVIPFNPPAIQGLGTVGGFEFWIVDESSQGDEELEKATEKYLDAARKRPELGFMTAAIDSNAIQIFADLDRTKARAYNVTIGNVYQTLQSLLGSVYVNNFNKFGQVFQVMVQAEPEYRSSLDQIGNIFVRSEDNKMIPIKSLVNFRYSKGSNLVSRFNVFPAVKITGAPAAGVSVGPAMKAMVEVAEETLPQGMSYSWSGAAYQMQTTKGASSIVLLAALILVFLILAALYERWSLPLAILLGVPFGIFGALLSTWIRGLDNDVYLQIGLVTLIALAAKNAILIVEFAIARRKEGLSSKEAALMAARQRFRAILMTSFTFIFGVFPLVFSSGAGAASRHSVGTGVMGGMIFATILGVFFIPLFYRILDRRKPEDKP